MAGGRAPTPDLRRADLPQRRSAGFPIAHIVEPDPPTARRHVNVIVTGRDAAPELTERRRHRDRNDRDQARLHSSGIRARCAASTTDAPERASCTVSLTLLVGGARSGKSSLAVEIGLSKAPCGWTAAVTFIATAPRVERTDDARHGSTGSISHQAGSGRATLGHRSKNELDLIDALASVDDGPRQSSTASRSGPPT